MQKFSIIRCYKMLLFMVNVPSVDGNFYKYTKLFIKHIAFFCFFNQFHLSLLINRKTVYLCVHISCYKLQINRYNLPISIKSVLMDISRINRTCVQPSSIFQLRYRMHCISGILLQSLPILVVVEEWQDVSWQHQNQNLAVHR